MKKLVYISSIAAPHQVKLCQAMQEYYKAQFWYYDEVGKRADWWRVELGSFSKVLPKVKSIKSKYITTSHLNWLDEFDPDIVMLGGFSIPANYLAYRWARRNGKKTVVFTERSRTRTGKLRRKGIIWSVLHWLYKDVDLVMVSEKDIVPQFRDEFGFGDKVVAARYAADIGSYLDHPLRQMREGYTFMFPNRLTELYNPLGALEIFKVISQRYPLSKIVMNALGEQREECEAFVKAENLANKVEFLDHIESWSKLHEEYRRCDIMIFPAKSSNGNFTIIEAMASGMGIVISDQILGVGNYIVDGKNGYRVAPNLETFVQRIEQFVDDPTLLLSFGKKNRTLTAELGPVGTAKLYHDIFCKHLIKRS